MTETNCDYMESRLKKDIETAKKHKDECLEAMDFAQHSYLYGKIDGLEWALTLLNICRRGENGN